MNNRTASSAVSAPIAVLRLFTPLHFCNLKSGAGFIIYTSHSPPPRKAGWGILRVDNKK